VNSTPEDTQFNMQKILKTNASNFTVGACLYQIEDEQQRLIAYQSRKLSESEKDMRFMTKNFL
jgi:hypothetical protein